MTKWSSNCGESLPLTDDVLDDLKSYVIRYVYGDVQSSSLSLARAAKWKKQKKKSLICLPPDDDSLRQHIKRANFLACIQRHPDLRRHPSPISVTAGNWSMAAVDQYGTQNLLFPFHFQSSHRRWMAI